MGYVLHLNEEENLTLSEAVVRRLIAKGSGDAALLYICLAKHKGSVTPENVCAELHWTNTQVSAAEKVLREIGLVGEWTAEPARLPTEAPERECPEYGRVELVRIMENDKEFNMLRKEVSSKLNKILSDSDLNILMGLYDFLGLPADVIFRLVNHCVSRAEQNYGAGRRPTMKQIEKEGYRWARENIFTQEAASIYIKNYARRRGKMPELMRTLGLGERNPVASEEKYLAQWIEWGFGADAVEEAYNRTVFKCHELKWGYLNSILKSWNEKGLHTLKQIKEGDKPKKSKAKQPVADSAEEDRESVEWMRRYINEKRNKVSQ